MSPQKQPATPFFPKPWKAAGLILTYWCNCRCAICYLNCGPNQGTSFMSISDALAHWKGIEDMAAPAAKVHLTGGEPFANWPALLAILQAAHAQGLTAHELETNAFWCTDPQQVSQRCLQLDQVDLGRLVVSCDLYHQRYVPFQHVKLLVHVARDVLGPDRVRIRWRDFFANPVDISDLSPKQSRQAYRHAWHSHHDRLTGRAAEEIAPLLELHRASNFAGQNCRKPLLVGRHVHIDPDGNVIPGVCAGLVVGNARKKTLPQLWDLLLGTEDQILQTLIQQGPYGLVPIAARLGYQNDQEGFAGKCHLCAHLRHFLFTTGKFAPTIGPEQCYYEN